MIGEGGCYGSGKGGRSERKKREKKRGVIHGIIQGNIHLQLE